MTARINGTDYNITEAHLRLSKREITRFLHNAQLGAAELVADERIPAIIQYSKHLTSILTSNKFTPPELACVLVSTAWEIMRKGGCLDEKVSSLR